MNCSRTELVDTAILVSEAGSPAPPSVPEDPFSALFALMRVVVELSGVDASRRPETTGTFRL
ncbi:MAG: hypothetical protein AMXMBFR25_02010 [Lysobacterales bacterium]|nr:hypothetical protein [Xanthomonadales bacterium]